MRVAHSKAGPAPKGAKAKLSDMLTQEVSLVDVAANLRRFIVMKNGGDMTVAKAGEPPPAAGGGAAEGAPALTIPSAAKQTIMDGLAQALEKIQSVASAVASATIDDAAQVPGSIGEMLKESAAVIGGLANQFTAAPAPAAAGAPAPADKTAPAKSADEDATQKAAAETRKAELDAYTAMVTTVNAARERIYGAMNCMGTDPAKAVSELQAVGEMLTSVAGATAGAPSPDAPPEAAKAAKAVTITADLAKRLGAIAATAKAGRKIKGERFKRLTSIKNEFEAVLMELAEEEKAAEGDPSAATTTDPPAATAKSADPVELVKALGERLEAGLKTLGETVAKATATPAPGVQKQIDDQKVLLEKALKDVANLTRETPASNQGAPTGGPATDAPQVTWSEDMSAEVVSRKRGGASAQSNGK